MNDIHVDHELLQRLSDEVTARVRKTHGTVELQCAVATTHIVRAAKKEGIILRRAVGFWGMSQHHWAVASDGSIIDPTASQFMARNGVVLPDTDDYTWYDEIEERFIDIIAAYGTSLQYEAWLRIKGRPAVRGDLLITQEGVEEIRINHLGKPYFFVRYDNVYWRAGQVGTRPCSVTVMSTKKGDKYDLLVHWKTRYGSGKVRHYHEKIIAIPMGNGYLYSVKGTDGKFHGGSYTINDMTFDREIEGLINHLEGNNKPANTIISTPTDEEPF